jgi:hypothetical protein
MEGVVQPTTTSGPVKSLAPGKSRQINRIPDDILNDASLNAAIATVCAASAFVCVCWVTQARFLWQLPSNYNFEIHKTIWKLKEVCHNR